MFHVKHLFHMFQPHVLTLTIGHPAGDLCNPKALYYSVYVTQAEISNKMLTTAIAYQFMTCLILRFNHKVHCTKFYNNSINNAKLYFQVCMPVNCCAEVLEHAQSKIGEL